MNFVGEPYVAWDPDEAVNNGADPVDVATAVASYQAAQSKKQMRSDIAGSAGDVASLLGTTSDAASIGVLGMAAFMVALDSATTFAAFKTAFLAEMAKIAGGNDMVAISQSLLSDIEAGNVKVPIMVKGLPTVMGEIAARSTAVSDVLIASQPPQA